MSLPAQSFPLDPGGSFTEDAPRPPVPGEEGELVSTEPRPPSHGFYSGKGEVVKAETSTTTTTTTATPRRPDLDLGYEPEGSASPTPPFLRWAESLHSLLDDQDGIHLFRTFLKQEGCVDLLDFWFACSGFRKLEPCEANEEKRQKLAKAIYKKYVLDGHGIVSRQVKPATKSFIKDCVLKQLLDPAMFDQAQTEIQARVEENAYPLFLKSDIYLEYARTGGESPKVYSDQSSGSGTGKGLTGYLPTLNEDEEWKGEPEARAEEEEEEEEVAPTTTTTTQDSARVSSSRVTQKLLLEGANQRVSSSSSRRFNEGREFRHGPWREPVHPYYVNAGYALAPATSANDSEQHSMSSDADTVSLTDSSVDGIPPYRLRKQHRREMQESAKANGRLPLPHIPRTYRMPKDIHVEPQKFAAELIHRLEEVLRDREAEAKLEERLKRVRAEEEEGDDAGLSVGPPLLPHKPLPLPQLLPPHFAPRYAELSPLRDAHEENPESILDEHVQRVMKTPGCQSPGPGRHSPKPRSPDSGPAGKNAAKTGLKGDAGSLYHHKHVYHHLVHHHGALKAKEPADAEGGVRPQGPPFTWTFDPHGSGPKSRVYGESAGLVPGPPEPPLTYSGKGSLQSRRSLKKAEAGRAEGGSHDGGSPDDAERNQKILQWIIEGEKEISRHKKTNHSSSGPKKLLPHDLPRGPSSVERPMAVHPWVSAQLRNVVQPSHPFVQDPTMPPNPAPNPLTQLEEARRRLEEEEKRAGKNPAKQRYVQEVIQRGRSSSSSSSSARPACVPMMSVAPAVSDLDLSQAETKPPKRMSGGPSSSSSTLAPCENIVVAYYFCGEPIPYRTLVKGRLVTLGHFKELLTKKGNYRYYFKKVSDEFDCGVVFEEVREDQALLPIFEEKIIGKVEKID